MYDENFGSFICPDCGGTKFEITNDRIECLACKSEKINSFNTIDDNFKVHYNNNSEIVNYDMKIMNEFNINDMGYKSGKE